MCVCGTMMSVQVGPLGSGFLWSRDEPGQRLFGATGDLYMPVP
jgi:hypothetical protein